MLECPACRKEMEERLEFCPHCGEKVKKDEEKEEEQKKVIQYCIAAAMGITVIVLFFSLLGSMRNMGYQDGFDNVEASFMHGISPGYREGYAAGKDDNGWYYSGCNDYHKQMLPRHPFVEIYMKGYNACKCQKEIVGCVTSHP